MEYLYKQYPTHKFHPVIIRNNDGELGPQFTYPEYFRIQHLVYDQTANKFYILYNISHLTEYDMTKIKRDYFLFQEFLKMEKPAYINNHDNRVLSRRWNAFFDPEDGIVAGYKDRLTTNVIIVYETVENERLIENYGDNTFCMLRARSP